MPLKLPLIAAAPLALALLAGCGGAQQPSAGTTERPAQPSPRAAPADPDPLALPARVPLQATGAADPAAVTVIRSWSNAMRRSEISRASALWAVPAKIQNATPVVALASRADVRTFNESLACGSVLTDAGGADGGFTIATFRLTERPRGNCGSGVGASARTAIRVREGRITEWYRLADDPDAPRDAEPAEPAGPIV
ncbi:MAG: hypothetical protein ACR2LK_02705 [Solirubrobacteraceae bacterium]